MDGVIKFFNEEKRYGFIKGTDGTEYFFHEKQSTEQFTKESKGSEVSFEVVEVQKGVQAEKVTYK